MTHTFKLSRRMSRFRALSLISALLAASACDSANMVEPDLATDLAPSFATATPSLTISNLSVRSGKAYRIVQDLSADDRPYIDRTYRVVAPTPNLVAGSTYIQTANDDKDAHPGSADFLSFDINVDAVVYVAHDDRLPRPAWLTASFRDTDVDVRSSDPETKYSLFTRTFPRGRVTLGSNVRSASGKSMYFVIMRPLAPATSPTPDLFPPPASPLPSTQAGLPIGLWHLPPAQYATTSYSGAYLGYNTVVSAPTPAGFLEQIAQAKRANVRLMINLVGRRGASGGGPDMAYYLSELAKFKPYAAQLQAYADDGTIVGIMLADEPYCASCWGGQEWTTPQLQQVAEAVRDLVPRIPRGFRADPAWLRKRNAPALYAALDFAWTQYEGPLHLPCATTIQSCLSTMGSAAAAIGLKMVMGLNTLDGGDGSSGIPGTFNLATVKTRWQLSAAEVLKYGLPIVTDPRVCGVFSWRYGANATKPQISSGITDRQLADILSFDTRMRSALDSVSKVATTQVGRSCRKA